MAGDAYGWADLPHLARRAWWSIRRPEPDGDAEAWLLAQLEPGEALLYRTMSPTDRAHAVASAQHVRGHPREVVVASALHDVGKVEAGLGVPGRIVATLFGLVAGDRLSDWSQTTGFRRQIAAYLDHADRGAEALAAAGAPELAVTWAREHHLPPAERTIAADLGALLSRADR